MKCTLHEMHLVLWLSEFFIQPQILSVLTQTLSPCLLRTLGTPNNDVWPDVESLPDYKNTFPKWKSGNLSCMVKNLDKNGLDLLAVRKMQRVTVVHSPA